MAGSPDSSISLSSLLASCSLGSSKGSSGSSGSIEYKEKLYDSATKALEAYIEDYEQSLRSPMASTGKIHIHSTASPSSTKKRDADLRLVHSPRRRNVSRDPDLLSLTTDDLLGFPSDGSLRFSQVSRRKNRNNYYDPSFPNHATPSSPLRSSLNTRADLRSSRQNSQSLDLRRLGEDLKENRAEVLLEMDREAHPDYYNPNFPYLSRTDVRKSYPRWLTSQKSDLGVSGITSIPEVKYPLWIKDYGLLGTANSPITKDRPKTELYGDIHGSSSMASLRPLYADRRGREEVNSGGKFYSGLSDLDVLKHLHTPPKYNINESALRRSEALESSQRGFPDLPGDNGSPRTEDVLEAERSWEKVPYSLKSPVPIPYGGEMNEEFAAPLTSHVLEDFLKDRVKDESQASSFSGGNHHGPVEALKHMLFNLQTFQQNFTPTQSSKKVEEFQKVYTEAQSEIQRADQEAFPVNKSLQKALQHLARLKELVGDSSAKQDQEHNKEIEI